MRSPVERHTVRSLTRLGYVFTAPLMLLVAVYLVLFLGLNSRQGSERLALLVSSVLQGELQFEFLRVGPDLLTLELYEASLLDVRGRAAVEASALRCRFRPEGLVRRRLLFDDCYGRDGRVLIVSYDNGDVGLMTAFEGRFRPKNPDADPLVPAFEQITLDNIDVLIQLKDVVLRFDGVAIRNGRVEAVPGRTEIDADAVASGGRFVIAERAFMPTDRRGTWDEVLWDVARRRRPWAAAYADVPSPNDTQRGVLSVPVDEVAIERFRWRGEAFEFERLRVDGPVLAIDAAGSIRLVPETPKVPDAERGLVAYEGRAQVSLPTESPVFDFALPGVFGASRTPDRGPGRIEPLSFSGYGTVRFFEGATRLRMQDVDVLGWNLAEIDAGLSWSDGTITLSDDSRVRAWGGVLTGSGTMGAHDGVWQLNLCADGVRLDAIARPWLDDVSSLDARLTTSPAVCGEDGVGIRLLGDLTRKGLGIAPAATTLAGWPIPAPLISGQARDLSLRWASQPAWLPAATVRLDIGAALSTRGVLQLARPSGAGVVLRAGQDRVTFDGGVDVERRRLEALRVTATTPHFERWLALLVDGQVPDDVSLTTSFTASGPWDRPTLERITLAFEKADDDRRFPAFSLSGDLRIDGDVLRIDDGVLTSSVGTARARGSVRLLDGSVFVPRREPSFDLTVAMSDVDLARVAPGIPMDASLDATFALRGTPGALEVSGTRIEAIDFRLYGEPIDYLSVGDFFLSNDRIVLDDLFVVKGKGLLEGDVAVDLEARDLEIALAGSRFRLEEFRTLDSLGASLRGRVDAVARISGSFDDPRIAGSAVGESLEAFRLPVGGAAFTFATFEQAVEVAGAIAGDIDVAARIPIDGSPVEVAASFHRVSLEDRVPELRDAIDRSALSGRAVATVDPTGAVPIAAQVTLEAMELVLSGRTFDIARPARLSANVYSDGALAYDLALDELAIGTDGRYLRAGGNAEVPREAPPTLRFVVAGETDLSLLRFVPNLIVDAEGPAVVDIKVSGPADNPLVDGQIAYGRSRIAPRGLGTSVFIEPGVIAVGADALTLAADAPMVGTVFGGEFSLDGQLGFRGLLPSSVDVRAFVTNLTYRVPDELNATLTADVAFRAGQLEDAETWTLTGAVEVTDARWYGDIEVVGDSLSFGGFGRTVDRFQLPVWRRVEALEQLRTDLVITGRDRFRVDNRIADAEMQLEFRTDLRLTGPLGEMVLVGEMEALDQGTVSYRGRQFDVSRATLFFEGGRDPLGYPMPRLESELEASIQPCVRRATTTGLDATGTATGTLDTVQDVFITAQVDGQLPVDLNFNLESTPFYDQRDLLSLILTGCTVDELTAGEAGGRTLEVVLRPFLDAVERNVEERLALEDVELVPAIGGSAGITIQDEVSERFTWTFDAVLGSGNDNQQVVRGAYRLFDWLSVELQEQTSSREPLLLDGGLRFRLELD